MALILAIHKSVVLVLGNFLSPAPCILISLIILGTTSQVILIATGLILQGVELFGSAKTA